MEVERLRQEEKRLEQAASSGADELRSLSSMLVGILSVLLDLCMVYNWFVSDGCFQL